MLKNEFIEKVTNLGKLESVEEIRSSLATLSTEVQTDYDAFEEERGKVTELNGELKKVRESNMELFLQVSTQTKDDNANNGDEEQEKLNFSDLFNEKGELI